MARARAAGRHTGEEGTRLGGDTRSGGHVPVHTTLARAHDHGAQPVDSGPLTVALVVAVLVVTAVLASALPCGPAPVSGPLRTVASVWVPKSDAARRSPQTRRGPPVVH